MPLALGIPRALLYYKYPSLWETFFHHLGAEVIVSPPTNRRIVARAIELAESEFCLPVKVFHGHLLELCDKVDALFIPRVVSVQKGTYTCPKFFGLPDIVAALPVELPRLIAPTINLRLGRWQFYRTLFAVGAALEKNAARVFLAWRAAVSSQKRFAQKARAGCTTLDILEGKADAAAFRSGGNESALTVAVVGHPYNLYDSYVSVNLIDMLRRYGVKVVVPEMLPNEAIEKHARELPKKLYWSYEREVVGAMFCWLRSRQVDGMIYMRSFACGPDSIVQTILDTDCRIVGNASTISLAIDEHTAEAGVITRVEAFLDMLQRKKVAWQ
ncbi:MAG: acyl-CoA dehydratase activase-related protein [Dehalococcoidales bacterium]|nr:acyl-CoA dehydratase activase-related protein [Dehalococcoidales bacterium]